jgi:hypothetical protein
MHALPADCTLQIGQLNEGIVPVRTQSSLSKLQLSPAAKSEFANVAGADVPDAAVVIG